MAHRIRVHLKPADHSYVVHVQAGLFHQLVELLGRMRPRGGVFIITDSNVKRLYGAPLLQRIAARLPASVLLDFPAGEHSKNLNVTAALYDALLAGGIRRDSIIVALGGGVVGDVAGFVAATVLRGVAFVQVPTSLLAQVDSSVGGKCGIDHRLGKNLIGAFHHPEAVFADPELLRTLPEREYRSGLAEMVKISVALDAGLFRQIERHVPAIRRKDMNLLTELIGAAVGLKAEIVRRDERESGVRASLNLGHTLGHALEAASSYRLRHGEAVAIGTVLESELARRLGVCSPRDARRIRNLLVRLGLPTRPPSRWSRSAFRSSLALDKKATHVAPRWVLPSGVGRCVIGVEVEPTLIRDVMKGTR